MGRRRGRDVQSHHTHADRSETAFRDTLVVLHTLRRHFSRSDAGRRDLHDETESEKLWQSLARRSDGD